MIGLFIVALILGYWVFRDLTSTRKERPFNDT